MEILRQLRVRPHPHLLGQHASGANVAPGGRVDYAIMPFAGGGDLLTYLRTTDVSVDVARRHFVRIVLAVRHLHALGWAHRDVSLENVLLVTEPESEPKPESGTHTTHAAGLNPSPSPSPNVDLGVRPVLGDYGLAVKLGNCPAPRTCRPGKPGYMSPEIFAYQPYDAAASDVYSLGVVLFGLLARALPYNTPTPTDVAFRMIQNGQLQQLLEAWSLASRFRGGAVELVAAMLSTQPTARPTLEEVLAHPWCAPAVAVCAPPTPTPTPAPAHAPTEAESEAESAGAGTGVRAGVGDEDEDEDEEHDEEDAVSADETGASAGAATGTGTGTGTGTNGCGNGAPLKEGATRVDVPSTGRRKHNTAGGNRSVEEEVHTAPVHSGAGPGCGAGVDDVVCLATHAGAHAAVAAGMDTEGADTEVLAPAEEAGECECECDTSADLSDMSAATFADVDVVDVGVEESAAGRKSEAVATSALTGKVARLKLADPAVAAAECVSEPVPTSGGKFGVVEHATTTAQRLRAQWC